MKVKICKSCGAENSPAEIECCRCMGDISGVRPTEKDEAPAPLPECDAAPDASATVLDVNTTLNFVLITGGQNGEILSVKNGDVLGREHVGRELFAACNTVSRRHAKVLRTGGEWTIEDAGSMNGTYVNGRKLEPGRKHPLKSKDVVALSRSCEFLIELGR